MQAAYSGCYTQCGHYREKSWFHESCACKPFLLYIEQKLMCTLIQIITIKSKLQSLYVYFFNVQKIEHVKFAESKLSIIWIASRLRLRKMFWLNSDEGGQRESATRTRVHSSRTQVRKTMKITLLWRNGLSEGMFYSYSTLDDVYSTLLHSIQASLTNIFSELLKWK